MATREIAIAAGAAPKPSRCVEITRGLWAVVTTLFFMCGFLTCLNEILVPHLKAIFDLSYAQVMLTPILGVKK